MSSKYPDYRKHPLIGMLVCGIIIILVGIYLTASNQLAVGSSLLSRKSVGTQVISGAWAIAIGASLAAFPVYIFWKMRGKK